MKTEDFDKLQELLKDEFEVVGFTNEQNSYLIRKKKDIWEGVEFLTVNESNIYVTEGVVYPIIEKLENGIFTIQNNQGDKGGLVHISHAKPSTESAYIEQLKRIAFEKFGEIKEGDRFDTGYGIHTILPNHPEWNYNKHIDFLYYKGLIVYSKGIWAKKLHEIVKVKWVGTSCDTIRFEYVPNEKFNLVKLGPKMAEILENYLNDTNNNKD